MKIRKFLLVFTLFFSCESCERKSIKQEVNDTLDAITMELLNDEIEKFKIVLKSDDKVQICVQAQMISALLLELKDEKNYLEWKKIEEKYCEF